MAGFVDQLSRGRHPGLSPGQARFWIEVVRSLLPGIPDGVKGFHSIAASSSVTTISTVIPARTVTGDLGIAVHAYNPATEESPTPAGWTLVDTLNISATAHARIYKKVMALSEAGTNLTFTNTTAQRLSAGCVVLDGAVYGDVDVFAGVTDLVSQRTHAAPLTAVRTVPGIELGIFAMRSSTPSVAITAPPSSALLTQAFGAGSGSTAVAIAINGARVVDGVPAGGGNWIETLANGSSALWTLTITAIPAAAGDVTVTPGTVTAVAGIPAPALSTDSVVTAVPVAAVASVPAPTVQLGAAISPATVTAVAAIPAPAVSAGGSATVSPATVAAVAAIPAPALTTSSNLAAATVNAVAAVPAASVRTGSTVSAAAVAATATIPAPAVQAGTKVAPAAVNAVTLVPVPTIRLGVLLAPASVAAAASVPAPTLHTSVLVPAFTVAAVATIPAPAVITLAPYTPLTDPVTAARLNLATASPRANGASASARPNPAEAAS